MLHRIFLVAVCLSTSSAMAQDWVEKKSVWRGFSRAHFTVDDKPAWVTSPEKALPGNPWVWRARFPDYHAEMDEALLKEGFHVGYVDVAGLFGAPLAMKRGDQFYKFVTENVGLSKRVALEGVSRGGLFVYNWAVRHPEAIACIYCDTPVCDFKSWPGGKGLGIGHQPSWKQCLTAYAIDGSQALSYSRNPIDHAKVLAQAKIPLMTVISENDQVVPPRENTLVLQQRLAAFKHPLEVIRVPEGTEKSNGHHFTHPEPKRVVEFIRKHAAPMTSE